VSIFWTPPLSPAEEYSSPQIQNKAVLAMVDEATFDQQQSGWGSCSFYTILFCFVVFDLSGM
jgi:hypothetical protein